MAGKRVRRDKVFPCNRLMLNISYGEHNSVLTTTSSAEGSTSTKPNPHLADALYKLNLHLPFQTNYSEHNIPVIVSNNCLLKNIRCI
jgi:hypothetical protein